MGAPEKYVIELLDPAKHRRDEFECGAKAVNEFLRHRARKEMQARASACFVAVPASDLGRIAGYYTLSAATISLQQVPQELVKKLPRYPNLPATLLGRLARDIAFRSHGLGGYLLVDALRRALSNTVIVGSVAVVTDPKDEQSNAFYQKYGFRLCTPGNRLVMPMAEIAASLNSGNLA